jgi:hypothetical protein
MKSIRTLLVFTLVAFACGPRAFAATLLDLNLLFDTLPSAQGWTFSGTNTNTPNVPESVYAADGTVLAGDTLGRGMGATTSGSAFYSRFIPGSAYDATQLWKFEWEARVLGDESLVNQSFRIAPGVRVPLNNKGIELSFDRDQIFITDQGASFGISIPAAIGTDWARFDFVGDPVTGAYSVAWNGAVVRTGTMTTGAGSSFSLGDFSDGANAQFETRRFYVTQVNVPEPSTAVLLACGVSLLSARRRKPQAPECGAALRECDCTGCERHRGCGHREFHPQPHG